MTPVHYLVPVLSKKETTTTTTTMKFVLGPTPVQKKNSGGCAPLPSSSPDLVVSSSSSVGGQQPLLSPRNKIFRKATKEDGMEEVLQRVNFEAKFSSLPEYRPGESPGRMPSLPTSPEVSKKYILYIYGILHV